MAAADVGGLEPEERWGSGLVMGASVEGEGAEKPVGGGSVVGARGADKESGAGSTGGEGSRGRGNSTTGKLWRLSPFRRAARADDPVG